MRERLLPQDSTHIIVVAGGILRLAFDGVSRFFLGSMLGAPGTRFRMGRRRLRGDRLCLRLRRPIVLLSTVYHRKNSSRPSSTLSTRWSCGRLVSKLGAGRAEIDSPVAWSE
jgi:hypothetical protein